MFEVTLGFETPSEMFETRVDKHHFGVGFEARGLTLNEASSTVEILTKIDSPLLRFPGGSQTEAFFDLANPNNPKPKSLFTQNSATTFESLENFIKFSKKGDAQVVIVIPTYRYFDKGAEKNGFLRAGSEKDIANFIRDLLQGQYGEAKIAAFEIGNEWFNSRMLFDAASNPSGWTASEFGQLTDSMVRIIGSAIQSLPTTYEPDIWVQVGQTGDVDMDRSGSRDNIEILNALSQDTLSMIDGVIDHFYQPTRSETPLEVIGDGWVASSRIARLIEDGWNLTGPGALDIVTTEWNVRAARNGNLGGNEANITGFERLSLFLGLFSDMVASGVDVALAYTAQGIGPDGGSGTLSRFREDKLTPTGILFDLMSKVLPGSYLRDPNGDGLLTREEYVFQNENGTDSGVTYSFVSDQKIIIYYASTVNEGLDFSLADFSTYLASGYEISATVVRVNSGANPLDANVDGFIEEINHLELDGEIRNDGVIEFSLGPLEVIQIVLHPMVNESTRTTDQSQRFTSSFQGTIGDDLIFGLLGDDSVNGSSGNDTIYGSAGNDLLRGRSGDDLLFGESGDDFVFGGDGNDTLSGGYGNDLLKGGSGNDQIFGGAGDDTLYGGPGYDTVDGGANIDTIVFNVNSKDVDIAYSSNLVTIRSPDGETTIRDIEFARFSDATIAIPKLIALTTNSMFGDLGDNIINGDVGGNQIWAREGDDIVNGNGGNDTLDGGLGDDFIDGGEGADWISPGGGSDTVAGGPGNDMLSFFNLPDTPGRTNLDYRLTIEMGAGTAVSHDGAERIQFANIERLTGTIFADHITGSSSDDYIRGLGDYDWIVATEGADTIDGGNGQDMISFLEWQNTDPNTISDAFTPNGAPPTGAQATGVLVNLANPTQNTNLASGLTLVSVERVTGSARQDVFYGDDGQNDFRGLGDFDWFVSSDGGRECYYGGDGVDTVTYFNAPGAVTANLRNGAVVNGYESGYGTQGWAARDLYFEIENLVGSNFGDHLTGSADRNQLSGLDGDDFLFGFGNIDYLKGGAGNDTIDGGGSSDYALFDGDLADYTLTRTAENRVTVVGPDGNDSLIDVEYFRFDDQDVRIWDLPLV